MALTQISTAGVKDDAVTSVKIPTNAVGASEIADDAVTQAHIATDAVVTANIVDDAVNADKLASDAVVNASVASNAAIAGSKISPDFGSQNIVTTGTVGSGDLTITSSAPFINFIDSDHNSDFNIQINGGGLNFNDTTNSATRMSIDSSGNLLFGTTSSTVYDDTSGSGVVIRGGVGAVDIMRNNDHPLLLNRTGGDGQMCMYHRDGINKAASAIRGNDLCFDLPSGTEEIRFQNTGGISFNGDTAAANALDDYEEGTYTPTIIGTSSNPTQSYSGQFGHYVKIGKFVFISVDVQLASSGISGGSGEAVLTLPFTRNTGTQNYGTTAGVGYAPSWGAVTPTAAYGNPGTNWMYLMGNDKDTGANFISAGNVSNSTRLIAGFAYMTS